MTDELCNLSLFRATDAQKWESRTRTFYAFGDSLTLEGYLGRERHLDTLEHATNGKFTVWVLAPRDNPTTLDFKCSCETIRRKVILFRAGSTKPTEAIGYGVASVFTPPRYRGKGYASRMMRLVHWVLAPHSALPSFPESWGSPPSPEQSRGFNDAVLSVLYSDIGKDFYEKTGPTEQSKGWIVREANSMVFRVPQDVPIPTDSATASILDEQGCHRIWEEDSLFIKANPPDLARKIGFTFLPDEGVALYFHQYAAYYDTISGCNSTEQCGVKVENSYASWVPEAPPPPSTLVITRVRATTDTFPRIVQYMLQAARNINVNKVDIWGLPSELVEIANSLGGRMEPRDEHLSAFKWYGVENPEDVDWLHNERFAWI